MKAGDIAVHAAGVAHKMLKVATTTNILLSCPKVSSSDRCRDLDTESCRAHLTGIATSAKRMRTRQRPKPRLHSKLRFRITILFIGLLDRYPGSGRVLRRPLITRNPRERMTRRRGRYAAERSVFFRRPCVWLQFADHTPDRRYQISCQVNPFLITSDFSYFSGIFTWALNHAGSLHHFARQSLLHFLAHSRPYLQLQSFLAAFNLGLICCFSCIHIPGLTCRPVVPSFQALLAASLISSGQTSLMYSL